MLLSRLELIGFKSFGKRTKLEFHPGITGIIGPNGCGKSNIVDAIRWVMGEIKGSILRSERMEQLIFNGSKSRKQLGMAEVNLIIENNHGILPSEYTEVALGRRLYRDSKSEYWLNRQKCRLKDITDLFMDTGLGAALYSIIEQSLLNRILTEDPGERRALFEEAAGISKYRMQVETALRRLVTVNENLERIADVLTEVERNVKTLRRQYNQAKAYESLLVRVEELETAVMALDRAQLLRKLNQLNGEIENLRAKLRKSETRKAELNEQIETLNGNLSDGNQKVAQTRAVWEKFRSEVVNSENSLLLMDERERNLISERERLLEEIERCKQKQTYISEQLKVYRDSHAEKESQILAMNDEVDSAHERFSLVEKDLHRQQLTFEEIDNRLNNLKRDSGDIESEITTCKARITTYEELQSSLRKEYQTVAGRLNRLKSERKSKREEKKKAVEKLTEIENELSSLKRNLESLKTRLIEANKRKSELEVQFESLKSEMRFLQSLLESKDDMPGGVAHLLKSGQRGIIESLGNIIGVENKYAAAIETALGESAHYLIFDTYQDGISAIDKLRRENAGRACIIPLDRKLETAASVPPELKGVINTADKLIKCEPLFQQLIAYLLAGVLVVDSWENALQIYESGAWQGTIVTLEGELLGQVVISGGKSVSKFPSVGKKQRVSQITGLLQRLQDEILSLKEELSKAQSEISIRENSASELKRRRREFSEKIIRLDNEIAVLEAEKSALIERNSSIEEEINNTDKGKSTAEAQILGLTGKLKSLQAQISELEGEHQSQRQTLQTITAEVEQKREEYHKKQLQLTSRRGEVDKLKSEITISESRLGELSEEINSLHDKIAVIRNRLESMKTEGENLALAIEENKRLHDEWLEKLKSAESAQIVIKEEQSTLSSQLKEIMTVIEGLKSELSSWELRAAELNSQIAHKEDTAMDKFGVNLEGIEPPEPEHRDSLQNELEKTKRKLQAMGPVNLLALEEYDKEKNRFEFLQSEHRDIIESKDGLIQTISKTNAEARERFRRVFSEVANNFKLLFEDLFDGGEGEILLSSGDPLEAEIHIRANPAGKKLVNLNQLSGGEKALTAIALIFSLYQTKPSPFCILDEVDASLDDANVERFLRLLNRFKTHTQFILITHNKITMEACDYLYGVTMEEEGLSKIVSVELSNINNMMEVS